MLDQSDLERHDIAGELKHLSVCLSDREVIVTYVCHAILLSLAPRL
jgi:hypothetical protein